MMNAARGHVNGGCRQGSVNRSVMKKAIKAFDAGDVVQAWEVLDLYLSGLAEMTPPVDLDHGHIQTLVGFQTFEVIHEDLCQEVAQLYERLKPYIDANHPAKRAVYDAALRKWAELWAPSCFTCSDFLCGFLSVLYVSLPSGAYGLLRGGAWGCLASCRWVVCLVSAPVPMLVRAKAHALVERAVRAFT